MITVGQFVTDSHTGKVVKVIGAQQVFGLTTYQVYDPDTGEGVHNRGYQSWNLLSYKMAKWLEENI